MSVDDAVEFFAAHPSILHPLRLLQDVGSAISRSPSRARTLSGGEAQRIKLVTELARCGRTPRTPGSDRPRRRAKAHPLPCSTSPTVGFTWPTSRSSSALQPDWSMRQHAGVIEHNLDVMAEADWIIDLGPEGGDAGGEIVAQGSAEEISRRAERSHTGAHPP